MANTITPTVLRQRFSEQYRQPAPLMRDAQLLKLWMSTSDGRRGRAASTGLEARVARTLELMKAGGQIA